MGILKKIMDECYYEITMGFHNENRNCPFKMELKDILPKELGVITATQKPEYVVMGENHCPAGMYMLGKNGKKIFKCPYHCGGQIFSGMLTVNCLHPKRFKLMSEITSLALKMGACK